MTLLTTCKLCHPARGVIERGALWTMALNENQTLIGRCYFALNRHETDVTRLHPEEQTALFDILRRAKGALDSLFAPDHYNYVLLMNIEPHLHAHIIPRYKEPRLFNGEKFYDAQYGVHYDPSAERVLTTGAFDALVGAIGAGMAKEDNV